MLPSATAQTVTPLRLAAPDDGATSYDWEHIAYLLPGALPTLIDPGPEHLADALLNALAESGIAPSDIGQLLLTSHAAEMAGSASRFPSATIFAAGASSAPIANVLGAWAKRSRRPPRLRPPHARSGSTGGPCTQSRPLPSPTCARSRTEHCSSLVTVPS